MERARRSAQSALENRTPKSEALRGRKDRFMRSVRPDLYRSSTCGSNRGGA
jgi:hypothetical protein